MSGSGPESDGGAARAPGPADDSRAPAGPCARQRALRAALHLARQRLGGRAASDAALQQLDAPQPEPEAVRAVVEDLAAHDPTRLAAWRADLALRGARRIGASGIPDPHDRAALLAEAGLSDTQWGELVAAIGETSNLGRLQHLVRAEVVPGPALAHLVRTLFARRHDGILAVTIPRLCTEIVGTRAVQDPAVRGAMCERLDALRVSPPPAHAHALWQEMTGYATDDAEQGRLLAMLAHHALPAARTAARTLELDGERRRRRLAPLLAHPERAVRLLGVELAARARERGTRPRSAEGLAP